MSSLLPALSDGGVLWSLVSGPGKVLGCKRHLQGWISAGCCLKLCNLGGWPREKEYSDGCRALEGPPTSYFNPTFNVSLATS